MVDEWTNQGKLMMMNPSDTTASPSVGEPPFALLLDRIVPGLMDETYTLNIDTDITYDDITTGGIAAINYVEPGGTSTNVLASAAKRGAMLAAARSTGPRAVS